jgi:HlyD family secretion protein
VNVQAQLPGRLLALHVREGDAVKKGDLMATLDARALAHERARGRLEQATADTQASAGSPQLAALQAQAQATEVSLREARAEEARARKLAEIGAATMVELERAATRVQTLDAQLTAQRAQGSAQRLELRARARGLASVVASLDERFSDAEVRAPIDGVVLSRFLQEGELAAPQAPIMRVGDTRALQVESWVDETDISRVELGASAHVALRAFADTPLTGRVLEIAPDADRIRKAFLVKVEVPGLPPGARSGMSADVNIIVAEHRGVLILPNAAIDGDSNVWVVVDDHLEKRHVDRGLRDMQRTEICSGLSEGERVLSTPRDDLVAGQRVRARAAEARP